MSGPDSIPQLSGKIVQVGKADHLLVSCPKCICWAVLLEKSRHCLQDRQSQPPASGQRRADESLNGLCLRREALLNAASMRETMVEVTRVAFR